RCVGRPDHVRDFAALRGDPSDNLPGVRGIGPRTAARLLQEFGSAAAAFDDLAAVRSRLGARIAARLADPDARATWELNCQVMAMNSDVPVEPAALTLDADAVSWVFRARHLVCQIYYNLLCRHDASTRW